MPSPQHEALVERVKRAPDVAFEHLFRLPVPSACRCTRR
jgi:hypothetical protein